MDGGSARERYICDLRIGTTAAATTAVSAAGDYTVLDAYASSPTAANDLDRIIAIVPIARDNPRTSRGEKNDRGWYDGGDSRGPGAWRYAVSRCERIRRGDCRMYADSPARIAGNRTDAVVDTASERIAALRGAITQRARVT